MKKASSSLCDAPFSGKDAVVYAKQFVEYRYVIFFIFCALTFQKTPRNFSKVPQSIGVGISGTKPRSSMMSGLSRKTQKTRRL